MTDVFFTPAGPPWTRYVALGDSFTEGLCDAPHGPEDYVGWADRLAQILSARRVRTGRSPLQYANLAVRGKLLEQILTDQLPQALEFEPDLISIAGGGNDLLRPGVDADLVAARLERAVRAVRGRGIDVVIATAMDTRTAGALLRAIRPKVAVFNAHVWSIARRNDAHVLDVWGLRALQDWRMWAPDRIHLSTPGHERIAQAALVALGLPPDDEDWMTPLQAPPQRARSEQFRDDVAWLRRDVYPWAARRLRGKSSGDGYRPKKPDLTAVDVIENFGNDVGHH